MKEELTIVRRVTNIGRKSSLPQLKLFLPSGRFNFNHILCKLINLENNQGVMFAFDYKNKLAYMVLEDEPDSFRINAKKNESGKRFTSKDLAEHFTKCFEIPEHYKSENFDMETTPNEK